jgi:hypothetical protein
LQEVTTQLLDAAEERFKQVFQNFESTKENIDDGTFTFIGEAFARICRRGHAGNFSCFSYKLYRVYLFLYGWLLKIWLSLFA